MRGTRMRVNNEENGEKSEVTAGITSRLRARKVRIDICMLCFYVQVMFICCVKHILSLSLVYLSLNTCRQLRIFF